MKKWYLLLGAVSVITLFTGCAPIAQRVSGDYQLPMVKNRGLVIFSTHIEDKCGRFGGSHAYLRRMDLQGTAVQFILKNPLRKPDIDDNGYFYVYEMEEGDYSMGDVSIYGFTTAPASVDNSKMVTFHVSSGIATYLGEVSFNYAKGCGFVTTRITDNWSRDSNYFAARIATVPPASVVTRLATVPARSPQVHDN